MKYVHKPDIDETLHIQNNKLSVKVKEGGNVQTLSDGLYVPKPKDYTITLNNGKSITMINGLYTKDIPHLTLASFSDTVYQYWLPPYALYSTDEFREGYAPNEGKNWVRSYIEGFDNLRLGKMIWLISYSENEEAVRELKGEKFTPMISFEPMVRKENTPGMSWFGGGMEYLTEDKGIILGEKVPVYASHDALIKGQDDIRAHTAIEFNGKKWWVLETAEVSWGDFDQNYFNTIKIKQLDYETRSFENIHSADSSSTQLDLPNHLVLFPAPDSAKPLLYFE